MINRITLLHQASLTYLQKAQQDLITKAFLMAMVLFTSCATPPRITYEGERNNYGEYHGKGTLTNTENLKKYIGEWKDGKKHGQGKDLLPDGK